MRLQKLAKGAPPTDTYRFMKVYLHRLGEDPDAEKPIFGNGGSGQRTGWRVRLSRPPRDAGVALGAGDLQPRRAERADPLRRATRRRRRGPGAVGQRGRCPRGGDRVRSSRGRHLPAHAHWRVAVLYRAHQPREAGLRQGAGGRAAAGGVLTALGVAQDGLYVQMLDAGPPPLPSGFRGRSVAAREDAISRFDRVPCHQSTAPRCCVQQPELHQLAARAARAWR